MNFKNMFEPKTVAIIGISSENERHPANVIYNKLRLRHPVQAFAVSPRGGFLQGEKIHPSVADIPAKIDLAVIAVRAEQAAGVMEGCIQAGVGGAVVISGGFAESGRRDLQDRLVDLARAADFPFIGPNCLGIYSPGKLDTFFLPSERMMRPQSGNVAIVSQSGGVLVDQMVKFTEENIGLSLAVSIGNKAMVKELELLDYLSRDPGTDVIAFYIEGFGRNEGRYFVEAASRATKPVIVLKAGKSPGGTRAISSHTASLGGDYKVFSEILAQYGLVEAKNEFELISFCESLSHYRQTLKGKIGIVTISGGHGALAVDFCSEHGLSVPQFSPEFQEQLRAGLPDRLKTIAGLSNPVDLTGSGTDDDFVAVAAAL
ncbi:MAG: CoA-binding protein, partial [Desulfobacteraceae bacterium]